MADGKHEDALQELDMIGKHVLTDAENDQRKLLVEMAQELRQELRIR